MRGKSLAEEKPSKLSSASHSSEFKQKFVDSFVECVMRTGQTLRIRDMLTAQPRLAFQSVAAVQTG